MSESSHLPTPGRFGETRKFLRDTIEVYKNWNASLQSELADQRVQIMGERERRNQEFRAHEQASERDASSIRLLFTTLVPLILEQDRQHLLLRSGALEKGYESRAAAMIDLVEEGRPTIWLVVSVTSDLSARLEIESINPGGTVKNGPVLEFRFRDPNTREDTFDGATGDLVGGTAKDIQDFMEKARTLRDAPEKEAKAAEERQRVRHDKVVEMLRLIRSYLEERFPTLTAVDSTDERLRNVPSHTKDGLDLMAEFFVIDDERGGVPVFVTVRCEQYKPDTLYARIQIGPVRKDVDVDLLLVESALAQIEAEFAKQTAQEGSN